MLADLRPAGIQGRPLAQLAELLGVGLHGPGDPLTLSGVTVSGVTHDSRRVRPGDLYAALPGGQHHGADFCQDAARAGAVAVLTDPGGRAAARRCGLPVDTRPYRPHLTLARTLARARDPATDLAPLAAALDGFAGRPWSASDLHLVRSVLGAGPGRTAHHEPVASWPFSGRS